MNENIPDRRSAAAFDKERLVALSSLLQKQFARNQLCPPGSLNQNQVSEFVQVHQNKIFEIVPVAPLNLRPDTIASSCLDP